MAASSVTAAAATPPPPGKPPPVGSGRLPLPPATLRLFDTLTAASPSDRAAAASALVNALSGSSAAGVAYALRRLVRGTASSTGCARLGFAAAITAALRAAAAPAAAGTPLADLTPDAVVAAIADHYKGRSGAAGAGEGVNLREAALGRLFSTAAVVRAIVDDDLGDGAEAGQADVSAGAGVVPPLRDDALASAMSALAATATTGSGRWGLGDAAATVATTLLGTPPHPPASAAVLAAATRRRDAAAACPAATSTAVAWATARSGTADGLVMATSLSAAGLAPSPGWLTGLYGRLDTGGGSLLITALMAPLSGSFPAPAAADAVAAAWRSAGRAVVAAGGGEALAALWTRGVTGGLLGAGGSTGKRVSALVLFPVGIVLAATVPSANGRAVALQAVLSPAASTALVAAVGGGGGGGGRGGGRRPGRGGVGRGRGPHSLRRPAAIDATLQSPAAKAAARSAGPAIAAALSALPPASGAPTAGAVLKWATATPMVGRALGAAALRSLAATADVGAVVAAAEAVLGSPRRKVAADAMALDVLAAAAVSGGGALGGGAVRGRVDGGDSDGDDSGGDDGGGSGAGDGGGRRAVAVASALASVVARGRPGVANAVTPATASLAGRKLLSLLSAKGEGGVGALATEALARLAAAGGDEGLTDNDAVRSTGGSGEDEDMDEDKGGEEDEDNGDSEDSDDDDDGGRSPAVTAAAMEAECAKLLGAPPAADAPAVPPGVTAAFQVLLSIVRLARMLLGTDRAAGGEGVRGNDDVKGDANANAGASGVPKATTTADADFGPYLSDLLSALRVALGAVYAGEAEGLPTMVDDDDSDNSTSSTDSDGDGDSAGGLSPAGHLMRVLLAGIATPSAPLRDAVAAVWRELVAAGGVDSDALDVLFTVFDADAVDAAEEEEDGEEGGGSADSSSTIDTDSDEDEDEDESDGSHSDSGSSDEASAAERPSRAAGTDDDAMDESATDSDSDSDSTSSGDSGIDPDSEDPANLARYDASLTSYLSLLAAKRGASAAAARRRGTAAATRQRALELVTIYARSCRRLLTTFRSGGDGSADGAPPSEALTAAAAGLLSLAPRLVSAAASSPDAAVRSGEVLAKYVTRTPAVLGRVLGGAPIGAQVAAAVVATAADAPTSALSAALRTAASAAFRGASAVYVHVPPAGGGAPFEEETAAAPGLAALALYTRSRGRRWLGGGVEAALRRAPAGVAARLAAAAAAAVADPVTSAYVRAGLVGELARGLATVPAATAARAEVWAAARDAAMAVVAGCGGGRHVKAEDRRDPLGGKAARWKELVALVSVALGGKDGTATPGAAAWTSADLAAVATCCSQRGFPLSLRATAKWEGD